MPRPLPEASSQLGSSQRTIPFARPKSDSLPPTVVVRKATTPQDSAYDDLSSSDPSESMSGRRRSTNVETAPQDARPLGYERRAVNDGSKLDEACNTPLVALERAIKPDDHYTSDETVRRRSTYELISTAESDEGANKEAPSFHSQTRRTKSGRNVRRAVEEDHGSAAKRVPRRRSCSAPLNGKGFSISQETEPSFRKNSATDIGQSSESHNVGASGKVLKRIADIASNSFSHDGSSSTPSMSRRSTAHDPVQQANARPRSDDPNVAVPDDVDWRGAYGRRKTKDFGYPGARIELHGTSRTYKPLQDPDNWTKRACGHFSYMGDTESREETSKKLCGQCATKSLSLRSQSGKQQQTHQRAATDSPSLSSRSSEKADDACCHSSRRHEHCFECSPADKCVDTLAKDLGYIIDAILKEHTDTLQGVINNIRHSQPSLAQLRRMSEDLIQRCQAECQPIRKPVQQVCE